MVERALRRAFPATEFVKTVVRTSGDLHRDKPLSRIGGRGAFTRELDLALLDGRIDIAVHSAKDYPTEVHEDLAVAAYPCRSSVNDSLVARGDEGLADLPAGAVVGTGSLRRSAQIRAIRTDLRFADIRGNIETRLRKLDEGRYDAVVIAEAALRRLGVDDRPRCVLPISRVVPAAGQGALMVVCRRDDLGVRRMVARIDDPRVRKCVAAERAVLAGLGGGCRLPVGACAKIRRGVLRLRAVVVSPDGSRRLVEVVEGPAERPAAVAARAVAALLRRGAGEIVSSTR